MLIAMLSLNIAMAKNNIYRQKVTDATGQQVSLKQYKGKVMLIVNSATQCGFTPQYSELQALYEQYRDRGFEILDFPCNQFGGQAPGSFKEIHEFCTNRYDIGFTQFDKIDVNGPNEAPLYTFLKARQGFAGFDQNDKRGLQMHNMLKKKDAEYASKTDIKWNFTKFLVDRKGRVVKRFEPTNKMEEVAEAVKALL